jgi:hypothetical protein
MFSSVESSYMDAGGMNSKNMSMSVIKGFVVGIPTTACSENVFVRIKNRVVL